MFEAITKKNPKLTRTAERTPERVEFVGADEVLVSMRAKATGEVVCFSLKTAALVQMVNLSIGLINKFSAQVLRSGHDLGGQPLAKLSPSLTI
jgi:hypothetical protein